MKQIHILVTLCLVSLNTYGQLPGNSLQLKADANYVSIPDAASASLNTNITLEAWVYYKCENGSTGNMIMSKGWCGSTYSYHFGIIDQKLRFNRVKPVTWSSSNCNTANTVSYITDSQVIPYNTWTHVAVVINGLTTEFYVNGQLESYSIASGTNTNPGFINSTEPIRIGASRSLANSYGSLIGNLDDIRIWHTARTQSEIQNNMNTELVGNETGLIAYWKLNENGIGAGISVANSAITTSGSFIGTTVGTTSNLKFINTNAILDDLPTCDPILWLKADSAVYMNNGTAAATNGQKVQQWNDLSGNNFHVTQSDVNKRPTFQSNVIDVKPSVYFDGSIGDYFMNNTTSNLGNSGVARTVFVSGRRDCKVHSSGIIGGSLITLRRSGLINNMSFGANSYGTPIYIYSDNNGIGNNNATINSNTIDTVLRNFVITYKIPIAGSQLTARLNGNNQTVNQGTGSVTAETGATGFTIGSREDQPDLDWSGWINEVIVFNRTLTNAELQSIENYLKRKYPLSPTLFNAIHTVNQSNSDQLMDDGKWKHSYNSLEKNKIIASIQDNCFELGARSDTVYVEPNAGLYNGQRYMRRHFVIHTALNPISTKKVRLYYTDADFNDLQSFIPSLTSHNQLVVTKYDGINENGIYDPAGGTITFIPSSQITSGISFGQRYLEFDVNGFSEFWIHTGLTPLPLDLLSFNGYLQHEKVFLNWTTANKINVNGFEIEKSIEGKFFMPIGFVKATESEHYQFIDSKINNKSQYYRLKMLDIDNKFTYSNTISFNYEEFDEVILSPNPVKDELSIRSLNPDFVLIIKDIYGHELIHQHVMQTNYTVSCASFCPGLYVAIIQDGSTRRYIKFLKK